MRGLLAVWLAVLMFCVNAAAQSDRPNLSGRWVLADSSVQIPGGRETLKITAPDELAITQTSLAITIQHPSKPGTHPSAGTFKFGIGGTTSGVGGLNSVGAESRWEVSWLGSQLIISDSTTAPPNASGIRVTVAHGSTWSLDPKGRLIIEFDERRTGANPRGTTRVYVRSEK